MNINEVYQDQEVNDFFLIFFLLLFQLCPKGVADRVNLGLIPSSEQGWPVACAALKPHTGGMLHVHGNVTSIPKRKMEDAESMRTMVAAETVEKSDSPDMPVNAVQVLTNSNGYHKNCVQKVNGHGVTSESITKNTSSKTSEEETAQNGTHYLKPHNAPGGQARKQWWTWADDVAHRIRCILEEMHDGKQWNVDVVHVEHVKSYAPHVDHLVADIRCGPIRPKKTNGLICVA